MGVFGLWVCPWGHAGGGRGLRVVVFLCCVSAAGGRRVSCRLLSYHLVRYTDRLVCHPSPCLYLCCLCDQIAHPVAYRPGRRAAVNRALKSLFYRFSTSDPSSSLVCGVRGCGCGCGCGAVRVSARVCDLCLSRAVGSRRVLRRGAEMVMACLTFWAVCVVFGQSGEVVVVDNLLFTGSTGYWWVSEMGLECCLS